MTCLGQLVTWVCVGRWDIRPRVKVEGHYLAIKIRYGFYVTHAQLIYHQLDNLREFEFGGHCPITLNVFVSRGIMKTGIFWNSPKFWKSSCYTLRQWRHCYAMQDQQDQQLWMTSNASKAYNRCCLCAFWPQWIHILKLIITSYIILQIRVQEREVYALEAFDVFHNCWSCWSCIA